MSAKKTVLFCLMVGAATCNANAFFNGRLKYFSCENGAEAFACNKCKPEKNSFLQFEINQDNQVVLIKYFEGNILRGTTAPEGCKIANRNNWSCKDNSRSENGGYINLTHGMNDGIYFFTYESFSPGYRNPKFGINIEPRAHSSAACGR
jgi:hypothetical protein